MDCGKPQDLPQDLADDPTVVPGIELREREEVFRREVEILRQIHIGDLRKSAEFQLSSALR